MSATAARRPDASEHSPYFSRYVGLVPDGDILAILRRDRDQWQTLIAELSEARADHRYAEGKWSIREVVGHMIDTERIFAYRALRIARNDQTNLPGFEQDDYIPAAQFDRRPWSGLLEEFEAVRHSNVLMFRGLHQEAWERQGMSNGKLLSVRAAAYVIAGHERHHMKVLRDQYGV